MVEKYRKAEKCHKSKAASPAAVPGAQRHCLPTAPAGPAAGPSLLPLCKHQVSAVCCVGH